MKLSFGTWAFSFGPYSDHPFSLEDTARRIAQAGYEGIELCGYPPHVTLERYPSPQSRADLRAFLEDLGLEVSGYAADLSSINPVAQDSRTKFLALFREHVDLCRELLSPFIRVDTVAAPGSVSDRDYDKAFARVSETWREAAAIAQDSGVRMVWEFEPGYLFNKPSEVLRMHQEVGHPNFFILFDTAHAYTCAVVGARQHGARDVLLGGVAEFLAKLNGRIGAIHVVDSDGTLHADETSSHLPFGEGKIDFASLVPKLLRVPGVEWWTVDMCFLSDAWDLVEKGRVFAADLLKHHVALSR